MKTIHHIPSRRADGFTLIELMISMTIGFVLVIGMGVLLMSQNSARNEIDKQARQIESGRYATDVLSTELNLAGYFGQLYVTDAALTTEPNPCSILPFDLDAAIAMPVQAFSGLITIPFPTNLLSNCLVSANHKPGTDVIVVRRADTTAADITALTTGKIYIQSTPSSRIVGIATGSAAADSAIFSLKQKDGVTVAPIAAYIVRIYFVSPCNNFASGQSSCTAYADGGSPVPTLKRMELTVVSLLPTFSLVPIVDNIDELRFDYGIDTNSDGASDILTNTPTTAQEAQIATVGVNLLARNFEITTGSGVDKSYTLGLAGTFGPYNDYYKRHAYTTTARVINASGRNQQ
ncbi:MAG: type IV pilus assembly protein PilW [Porticoccaceae bacterium]|jgi:type IV pilus assembly protein PilW